MSVEDFDRSVDDVGHRGVRQVVGELRPLLFGEVGAVLRGADRANLSLDFSVSLCVSDADQLAAL